MSYILPSEFKIAALALLAQVPMNFKKQAVNEFIRSIDPENIDQLDAVIEKDDELDKRVDEIQELEAEIDDLKEERDALEARVKELEGKV